MSIPTPIAWTSGNGIRLLDQTLLPQEERYLELRDVPAIAEAIRSLRVRGAPLIGIAAAMGVAVAAGRHGGGAGRSVLREFARRLLCSAATRPTAVNLHWALRRMERRAERLCAAGEDVASAMRAEADAIWDEDRAMCARIGALGAELIGDASALVLHPLQCRCARDWRDRHRARPDLYPACRGATGSGDRG